MFRIMKNTETANTILSHHLGLANFLQDFLVFRVVGQKQRLTQIEIAAGKSGCGKTQAGLTDTAAGFRIFVPEFQRFFEQRESPRQV